MDLEGENTYVVQSPVVVYLNMVEVGRVLERRVGPVESSQPSRATSYNTAYREKTGNV